MHDKPQMPSRFIAFCALFLILFSPCRVQSQTRIASEQKTVLLRAMNDELARSIEGLKIANVDKPYFIEYAIEDAVDYTIAASFGAVTINNESRVRLLRARVRIGSYDFDNTGFINPADFFTGTSQPRALPFEDDYDALRHELWLATDAAYKQAVEGLARKKAFVQNRQDDAPTPDFSREAANVSVNNEQSKVGFDATNLAERVREMSNVFRAFNRIEDSNVQLRARFAYQYLVNSEGTRIREPQSFISLETRAATQTADGARLVTHHAARARTLDELPNRDEALRATEQTAKDLTALSDAPVLSENYSGPVLFEAQAASEMFAQVLVPHLSDERPPLAESTELVENLGFRRSALADRLGRPVLPRAFDVTDNPRATSLADSLNIMADKEKNDARQDAALPDKALFGFYANDNQGVKSRGVELIKDGVLVDLLASRRPRERSSSTINGNKFSDTGARSNGHGRAGSYGEPRAFISNLFIIPNADGAARDKLKQRLIAACQAENLAYGFIIRQLATPLSASLISDDANNSFFGGANREALSAPVLMYKVDVKTGAEQLVRGAELGGLSVRALRRILAWSSETYAHARIGSNDLFASGDIAIGLPSTVVAPSVLIDEMDIRRATGKRNAPTILTHPHFDTGKGEVRNEK